MPKLPLAALALLTLVACQPETPSPPEASSTDVELLAAGFFVHPRGIVRPYCHGVLTDERFVLYRIVAKSFEWMKEWELSYRRVEL